MTDAADIRRIESVLEDARAPITDADVAAASALDIGNVRRLLRQLMHRYECALDVREDGALVYRFSRPLRRLDKPTWRERFHRFGRRLWRGFSWAYRASLAFVLVAYAVAFVVLIIAAALAASAAAEDEGPAEGAFRLVGAIFRGIFEFTTHSALMYADLDGFGYRHRHFEPTPALLSREKKKHKKGFVAAVYDFVLGPDRVALPEGAQTRELAAFVRRSGGSLTVADVQALSGMSREAAEKAFARFVAEFEGNVTITADGVMVATFPALLESASRAQDAEPIYFWDEYEPPFELNGNSAGQNVLVAGLGAFNLAGALAVLSGALPTGAATALGVVPLIVFSLFFALPLLRWPLVWWNNRKQHETNIRKRLYRAIFGTREERVLFDEIVERANERRTTEEELDPEALRSLIESTIDELGSSYELNNADEREMDATGLRRELEASEQVSVEAAAEAVVFST